jgi:hypothetical protein
MSDLAFEDCAARIDNLPSTEKNTLCGRFDHEDHLIVTNMVFELFWHETHSGQHCSAI